MADSVQALEVEEPDPLAYASEQRREGEDEPPAPRAALTHPPSPHQVAPCPPLVMAAKDPTPARRPAPLQLNACFSFNSHQSGAEATLTLYYFMASYSLISSLHLFFQLYYIQAVLYGTSPAQSTAWRSYMDTPVWSQIGTGIFLHSPVFAHEILLYGLYGYSTQPGGDNSDLAQSFLHCCNFNAIFLHCRGFWFNAAYKLRCY